MSFYRENKNGIHYNPDNATSEAIRRVNEDAWEIMVRDSPGWAYAECEFRGVPWFGFRFAWIHNEFGYRLMTLLMDKQSLERERSSWEHELKCYARSFFGPPHVLISDIFSPIVRTDDSGRKTHDEFDWWLRFATACFRWNLSNLISRIYDRWRIHQKV